jgi:hypothetical protein
MGHVLCITFYAISTCVKLKSVSTDDVSSEFRYKQVHAF